jgi:hypothetical protein
MGAVKESRAVSGLKPLRKRLSARTLPRVENVRRLIIAMRFVSGHDFSRAVKESRKALPCCRRPPRRCLHRSGPSFLVAPFDEKGWDSITLSLKQTLGAPHLPDVGRCGIPLPFASPRCCFCIRARLQSCPERSADTGVPNEPGFGSMGWRRRGVEWCRKRVARSKWA